MKRRTKCQYTDVHKNGRTGVILHPIKPIFCTDNLYTMGNHIIRKNRMKKIFLCTKRCILLQELNFKQIWTCCGLWTFLFCLESADFLEASAHRAQYAHRDRRFGFLNGRGWQIGIQYKRQFVNGVGVKGSKL